MTKNFAAARDRGRPSNEIPDSGLREFMAVREIVHAFLMADRPEEVFQFALDRVSPLVGASFACVYLIEGGSELMSLAAVHNWPQRYAQFLGQMRVRLGSGPSGVAASERRAIEVPDVFADPSLEHWHEVATELGFRSLVALPLQIGHEVLGTVTFYFKAASEVSAETRHLLRMVADQMAATAEKARLIDDLRRTNTALQASNVELERQYAVLLEARRVKDEFLSNISHELRTPLTSVIGYVSVMQEGIVGPVTADQQQTLAEVKVASEQLLTLIADLLDLTGLRGGALDVEVTEFDIADPMRDAIAAAIGKRAEVLLDVVEPSVRMSMRSDRHKTAKILISLLNNAFKFTDRGVVRLSAEATETHVAYSVEDTGLGIPPDAHHLVFEAFRQLDGTMTRRHGGSGLGLSLARRLARHLGGDVSLVSMLGAGSTFRLELPLSYDVTRHRHD